MTGSDRRFGEMVEGWAVPRRPDAAVLHGEYAVLERLNAAIHAEELFAANRADDAIWDYLPYGPFGSVGEYSDWLTGVAAGSDPFFYAVRDRATGRAAGVASYLRITPEAGSIEVGHINFALALQRTRAATEAMYLMADWAFSAGYRRYEWKCNALNIGSRRAAERLGFSYEGVFRQAAVVKGRNRDTAWFAMTDKEWPDLRAGYAGWLDPDNFDAAGHQRLSLGGLTGPARVASDPVLGPK